MEDVAGQHDRIKRHWLYLTFNVRACTHDFESKFRDAKSFTSGYGCATWEQGEWDMASYQKSVNICAGAQTVWDAVSDVGQLHIRIAPGLVTDTRLDDGGAIRIVTFANGLSLKEHIVSNDNDLQRLVWSAESDLWHHHNASLQVFARGNDACEITWIADVLPHEAGETISTIMDMGLAAMKKHIESQ